MFKIKLTADNKHKIPIISKESIEQAKEVLLKYNIKKTCKRHAFESIGSGEYACKNCGFKESYDYVRGYNEALRHAKEL